MISLLTSYFRVQVDEQAHMVGLGDLASGRNGKGFLSGNHCVRLWLGCFREPA
jgi:hypothetical protein